MRAWLLLLLLFLVFTGTASAASVIREEQILSSSAVAPDGYVISTVNLDNVKPPFHSTTVLDDFGKEYLLTVNGTKSTWGWWAFDISLTDPNGNVSHQRIEKRALLYNNADIKVQYYNWELTGLDVDVYIGLKPLSAQFYPIVSSDGQEDIVLPDGYEYEPLAFSSVQSSCNKPFDFKAYVVDYEEFRDQVDNDLWTALTNAVSRFFDWAWDNVLAFVGKIPVIGPYFEISLTVAGMIFSEITFYFNLLIVENWHITFMLIESVLIGDAIMNTRSFWGLLKRTWENHVATVKFAVYLFELMIELWTKLVTTITQIVQALKPT